MKLAIFDLDGTLFNTDDVNYNAYKEAVAQFGFKLDKEFFVTRCNGRHYTEFLPLIMNGTEHMEEAHELKKKLYATNLDKAIENEELFDLINKIKDETHIAIVTTASRKNVEDILNFFNRYDLFEFILTQEDITKAKPDPQGFLMAMEHFGIKPEDTIIYEDSNVGLEAAKRSGAKVVKIEI